MSILWEYTDDYGDRVVFENGSLNMPEMDGDSLPLVILDDDAQRSLHEALGKEIKRKEDEAVESA